jgi:hypothetical protein
MNMRLDTGSHEDTKGNPKKLHGMVRYRHDKTLDDTNLELLFCLNYF